MDKSIPTNLQPNKPMSIDEILEELDNNSKPIDQTKEDFNWNTYDDNFDPKYQELLEQIKDLNTTRYSLNDVESMNKGELYRLLQS
jgi:non-homologous end joining protein Ku